MARFAPLSAPLRVAARAPLDALFVALPYAFPWDGLIGQLKFHERLDLTRPLAQRLATAWPGDEPAPGRVLAVPLAPQRLRARGYNQSALLARAALRHLGWPRGLLSLDGLVRTCDTLPQRDLSAAERVRNVRDAFAVPPGQAHQVAGQHVAVVDDVTTSGATLAEAARALKAAGASRVSGWALARTPLPGEG